jgi:hypothetical protein
MEATNPNLAEPRHGGCKAHQWAEDIAGRYAIPATPDLGSHSITYQHFFTLRAGFRFAASTTQTMKYRVTAAFIGPVTARPGSFN